MEHDENLGYGPDVGHRMDEGDVDDTEADPRGDDNQAVLNRALGSPGQEHFWLHPGSGQLVVGAHRYGEVSNRDEAVEGQLVALDSPVLGPYVRIDRMGGDCAARVTLRTALEAEGWGVRFLDEVQRYQVAETLTAAFWHEMATKAVALRSGIEQAGEYGDIFTYYESRTQDPSAVLADENLVAHMSAAVGYARSLYEGLPNVVSVPQNLQATLDELIAGCRAALQVLGPATAASSIDS